MDPKLQVYNPRTESHAIHLKKALREAEKRKVALHFEQSRRGADSSWSDAHLWPDDFDAGSFPEEDTLYRNLRYGKSTTKDTKRTATLSPPRRSKSPDGRRQSDLTAEMAKTAVTIADSVRDEVTAVLQQQDTLLQNQEHLEKCQQVAAAQSMARNATMEDKVDALFTAIQQLQSNSSSDRFRKTEARLDDMAATMRTLQRSVESISSASGAREASSRPTQRSSPAPNPPSNVHHDPVPLPAKAHLPLPHAGTRDDPHSVSSTSTTRTIESALRTLAKREETTLVSWRLLVPGDEDDVDDISTAQQAALCQLPKYRWPKGGESKNIRRALIALADGFISFQKEGCTAWLALLTQMLIIRKIPVSASDAQAIASLADSVNGARGHILAAVLELALVVQPQHAAVVPLLARARLFPPASAAEGSSASAFSSLPCLSGLEIRLAQHRSQRPPEKSCRRCGEKFLGDWKTHKCPVPTNDTAAADQYVPLPNQKPAPKTSRVPRRF